MKRNRIIFIIVIAFVTLTGVVFFAYKKYKTSVNSEENNQITSRYICYKETDSFVNSDNGISLKGNEEYTFFVLKDQSLSADRSKTNMIFNTLDDLKTYFAYLKNNYHYTEDSQNYFEVDENTLTLSYTHRGLYGSNKSNLQEYLDSLKQEGYSCDESKMIE